jgi:sigma-B regulation protein RsbU (phosphoserine phosphatase)
MFVTMACLDVRGSRVTCANGGHDSSLLVGGGALRAVFPSTGTVLGLFPDQRYESESVELRPGDTLVLYTDGVSEAANPGGALFGDERLHACFANGPGATAAESVERLLASVRSFAAEAPQSDDITILALRRRS